jgi:hypothetical protein
VTVEKKLVGRRVFQEENLAESEGLVTPGTGRTCQFNKNNPVLRPILSDHVSRCPLSILVSSKSKSFCLDAKFNAD